ncbi:MAG: hypothetical protein ACE5NW_15540 [Acidiferrobacterales bacterium]
MFWLTVTAFAAFVPWVLSPALASDFRATLATLTAGCLLLALSGRRTRGRRARTDARVRKWLRA